MPDIGAVTTPMALFDHNWAEDFTLSGAYSTSITPGLSADEARRGLQDKPSRVATAKGLTLSRAQAGAFLAQARRSTGTRYYMPVFCDSAVLTTNGISIPGSGPTVGCNTSNRRFFVGFKAMVVKWDSDKRASQVFVGTIQSIVDGEPGSITFVESPGFSLTTGMSIYPAIECSVDLDVTSNVITDQFVKFDLVGTERIGGTALPALAVADTIPGAETSYLGIPIMAIPHNWDRTETGATRKATTTSVGLDSISEIYGTGAVFTGKMTFRSLSRGEAFRLLKFFDCRVGSLFSFWVPGNTSDLQPVSRQSSTVWRVQKTVQSSDISEVRFLAFWGFDGTVNIRRVTTITDGGTYFELTFDSAMPYAAVTDVDRISFASLAKWNSDALEEKWQTDGTMDAVLPVIGLQMNSCNSGEVGDNGCDTFPDIPPPTTDDEPEEPWEPGDCEPSGALVPMFYDAARARNSTREPIQAADLNLPLRIRVEFRNGFVRDTGHVHSGAVSDEFLEALQGEHQLTYVGVMGGTGSDHSRNPYHIALVGTSPSLAWDAVALPGLSVVKHLWEKQITYTVGEVTHIIKIRFCPEHYPTPGGDPGGIWGTLMPLYVFSDEINAGYVDGTPYAPHNNAPFYEADPYVWGNYYSLGIDKKLAHPRLAIVAFIPTTFHAPNGFTWFPPDQERFAACYAEHNGAPWSSGVGADAALNSVFGSAFGSYFMRAITLGGGDQSELFLYMCIENGRGEGITALKPTKPGWDETAGQLTPLEQCDISVHACTPRQDGINPCVGHLDNPNGGIGGSHDCFRNSLEQGLCVHPDQLRRQDRDHRAVHHGDDRAG
jgi:hypothetical protein